VARLRPRLDGATVILSLALIVGALLRIAPGAIGRFPLNDGGMFLVMVDELKANGYRLPAFTAYNHAAIPYAYPPLGFYLAAAATGLGLSTLQALTWLPALLCVLTIPAFYYMSLPILRKRLDAAIATAFFTVTPHTLAWYIMGGGLTRAAGLLFALMAVGGFTRLFENLAGPVEFNRRKEGLAGSTPRARGPVIYFILAVLFGSFTVLSHPEATINAAGAVGIILLIRYRTWKAFLSGLMAVGGIALLTAPWWGTVIARHGLAPFLSAVHPGSELLSVSLQPLLQLSLTQEPLFPLIAALGFVGIIAALASRDWLLPVWFGLSFLYDPRSRGVAALFPFLMLAASALTVVLVPMIGTLSKRGGGPSKGFSNPFVRIFIYFVTFYVLINAGLTSAQLSRLVLPEADRQAMAWVRANTPSNSRFITITGNLSPMEDMVAEWFPALSGHADLLTIQGSEWTRGAEFWSLVASFQNTQTCFLQDETCLGGWTQQNDLDYDFVYVEKYNSGYPCRVVGQICVNSRTLIESLKRSGRVVYENDRVIIFGM